MHMKKRSILFLIRLLIGMATSFAPTAVYPQAEQPLYIVDSAVAENLDNLSPEDIASISVLKGKDAVALAALYGKSGTAGVVLIKTADPRQYLRTEDFLALYQLKLTPYTVLMSDNRLIADPRHYRIDTSQIAQVTRTTFNNRTHPDSVCKTMQLIKIYTKKFKDNNPAEAPVKKTLPFCNSDICFKNLQTIRSAGSELIYIQHYWSSNRRKPL